MDYVNNDYEGQRPSDSDRDVVETEIGADVVREQKINGQLALVDWKLIQALRMVYDAFAELTPPVRVKALEDLKKAIDDADLLSSKVAGICPPGCEPPDPTSEHNTQSFIRVARSLNLTGPRDWSSRLDEYLYGANGTIDE